MTDSNNINNPIKRTMGLFEATSVGVGAIVGGGILALAGVAFATTGPGAIVAFAVNGLIAVLTALSFSELSTSFPESGGTYTFAKKVLSVQVAFAVGWVAWFASIVAAVLYSLGFASFGVVILDHMFQIVSETSPGWLISRWSISILAILAALVNSYRLIRKNAGGGKLINIAKVIVFSTLIAGGLCVLPHRSLEEIRSSLQPFFPGGVLGFFQAMGYTFIALQGFDLIAAVGGEVRNPTRVIPRAMLMSLGIALVIYLPLLFIVATVGVQTGQSITAVSVENPETIIAIAARNYLGQFGYWMVMVAAVLSMLSALQANLFAASRVAQVMSRDRTLPESLEKIDQDYGTPAVSIIVTTVIIILILLVVPNVAAAGAAASLIFLITFALAHFISYLARKRRSSHKEIFKTPLFPLIPIVGGAACLALAIFQGISVPAAGLIAGIWLGVGGFLFALLFARRARIVDASAEAIDPQLISLRGKSPLVLVPIANPANAEAMVGVASALAPPGMGRVLLLSVVNAPKVWEAGQGPSQLLDAQAVLRESLIASFATGLAPEALTTVAAHPWDEIIRVVQTYRCETLLLGFSKLADLVINQHIENIMNSIDCDVVILRSPPGWRLSTVRKVLVPVGGRGDQNELRARLLSSLCRHNPAIEIIFLMILPEHSSEEACNTAKFDLIKMVQDEIPRQSHVKLALNDNILDEICSQAQQCDLLIMGLQRLYRKHKMFGEVTLCVTQETTCPIIMISKRG